MFKLIFIDEKKYSIILPNAFLKLLSLLSHCIYHHYSEEARESREIYLFQEIVRVYPPGYEDMHWPNESNLVKDIKPSHLRGMDVVDIIKRM